MHIVRTFAPLAAIAVFIAGCNNATTPEDFASNYADHLNQVADALENVKTRDDADAAAGNVESLLAGAKSLQEQAQNLTDAADPSQETQDRLKSATQRLGSEIARLHKANLITPKLQSALEQFRSSNEATMNYAKAGALPAPETPLEEAYVDYIRAQEDLTDVWNRVNDLASAQAAMPDFEQLWRRRDAALIRIAQAGGEMPPRDAPEKYRDHLAAATKRQEQGDARLNGLPDVDAIAELFSERSSVTSPEVSAAFRLSADIRKAGAGKMVTVTLRNNKALQGERHQLMSQMVKDAARAQNSEYLVDEDGTFRLVLSPVSDMQAFINRLDLGEVSNVDAANRTFVLTIDPSKVPQTADNGNPATPRVGRLVGPGGVRPGAPGGPRFPGRPSGNPAGSVPSGTLTDVDKKRIDEQRTRFVQENGAENLIEVYLKNCQPFKGPRLTKAVGTIGRAVRAKRMSRVPLQSGDSYLFVRSDKKAQELADAVDLGKIESVDESSRKLIITLDEAKVPQ